VAALLDHATTDGLIIRPQVIEMAIRSRIPIVFFGAKAGEDDAIEVVFERPQHGDAGEISNQLLAFLMRLAPGARQ
jgi:hypothetical protein